ncbi:MAG: hypothetical protein JNK67_23595 [Alphaproteobacteria bacterium]|nr:hypothetical protein [Alphaproteobacteria bacterium]
MTTMHHARAATRAAALIAIASTATTSANSQVPDNIIRQLRPLVEIAVTNPAAPSSPLALGIFDTGGTSIFIPPETNSRLGIGTAASVGGANPEYTNFGVIGAPIDVTVGGWLGATLGGPELVSTAAAPFNGPDHIFGLNGRRLVVEPIARTGISPSLTYFNAAGAPPPRFSEPNIGAGFYNGDGAGQRPLVAIVDPTQASYLPFASGNVLVPPPAGVNLVPPSLPLDQVTSSVSFLDPGSGQVPTRALNFNPDFLFTLTMTPQRPAPAATAANPSPTPTLVADFTRYADADRRNATRGARPLVTLDAANNLFGAGGPANGTYLADTGAPTTDAPATVPNPANPPVLGTDQLNRFGQYWDFERRDLLLFGPRNAEDRALAGPGILFNVDRLTTGLARTGVNQLSQFGVPPVLNAVNPPGNANGSPTTVAPVSDIAATGFYRSNATHANALYIEGVESLGLFGGPGGDLIDGLSMGKDLVDAQGRLFFSVDPGSVGVSGAGFGTGVPGQSGRLQQMGDIFESRTGRPLVVRGVNTLRFNQDVLGLGANVGPISFNDGTRGAADNLRDFDLRTQDAFVDADLAHVMRNVDPFIRFPGDARNPGEGITGNYGTRGDVLGVNFDTYFSLDGASPHAGGSGADVLVNNLLGVGFHRFALAGDSGLLAGDDIDGIALLRPGSPLQSALSRGVLDRPAFLLGGRYGPNFTDGFDGIDFIQGHGLSDSMLFSLARGSPTLGIFDPFLGRLLSPADVFITDFDFTFSLWASAESLGLDPFIDNIDGLDVIAGSRDPPLPPPPVAAPPTLVTLLSAVLAFFAVRSRSPRVPSRVAGVLKPAAV